MKVLKFGADWCSGCLVMGPRWRKIEQEYPWLETQYFNYDVDKESVEEYGVENEKLPTFIFLNKDNNEFLRLQGEVSEDKLREIINENKNT